MSLLKPLLFAILILLTLQIKFQGQSLEDHMTSWARASAIPQYVVRAAEGGAEIVKDGYNKTVSFVYKQSRQLEPKASK
jgi:hypothetical protein